MLGRDVPAFYATKYFVWAWNRYYKVYLSPSGLGFAFLAKRSVENLVMSHTEGSAGERGSLGAAAADQRYDREIAADDADPSSAAFVHLHKHNFQIDRANIVGWTMSRRPIPLASVSIGILKLLQRDSKPVALIIVGAEADLAEEMLEAELGPQL